MISRTTIALACGSNRWGKYPRTASVALARSQRGVTLIGLLTIAVAMGSLMVSRGVSGTVSDASSIQQQGAFAMRTIGLQLRQTGSLRLNLNPGIVTAAEPYLAPAAFETKAGQFDPTTPTGILEGKDSPGATEFKLDVRYSSYTEPLFVGGTQSQARDCLGANPDPNLLESKFSLRVNPVTNVPELVCASAGSIAAQPLVQNVANFQVRYLLQDNTSTPGSSTLKSVDAAGGLGQSTGRGRVPGALRHGAHRSSNRQQLHGLRRSCGGHEHAHWSACAAHARHVPQHFSVAQPGADRLCALNLDQKNQHAKHASFFLPAVSPEAARRGAVCRHSLRHAVDVAGVMGIAHFAVQ